MGTNDAIPIIPAPSTSDPVVADRNRALRSSPGSSSGSATRASTTTKPTSARSASTVEGHRRRVHPVAALGQRGHQQGEPRDEQHEPGDVDPARGDGPRLGQQPEARDQQPDGGDRGHDVRLAPAGPHVEQGRQHRAGGDPEPDAGAPHRGGVHAGGAGRELVGEQGESAGEDGGPADPLDDARADEQPGLPGGRADGGAGGQGREAGEVDASPAERVAEHARREQRAREPEAHRAEDPGPRDRVGAERRRRGRDGGDRGDVGDQHQRRPEGDRGERAGVGDGAASWFDIQTHSRHASTRDAREEPRVTTATPPPCRWPTCPVGPARSPRRWSWWASAGRCWWSASCGWAAAASPTSCAAPAPRATGSRPGCAPWRRSA